MKFPLEGQVKPQCALLGQSSLIIKTITEYMRGFVACSIHCNPENQPHSPDRAREGLRGKRSTFPVAGPMLLLLIKHVLAAFLEKLKNSVFLPFLSVLLGRDGT